MTDDLDLTIDEFRLDEEWLRQPKMYGSVATDLADAQKAYSEARAELEVTKSECELSIRRKPSKYGLEKVTEATVSAALGAHDSVSKATAAVIDAKHAVDVLNAVVHALDHRKKALENLVSLFLADYYSKPHSPPFDEEQTKARARRRGQRRRRSHDGE